MPSTYSVQYTCRAKPYPAKPPTGLHVTDCSVRRGASAHNNQMAQLVSIKKASSTARGERRRGGTNQNPFAL